MKRKQQAIEESDSDSDEEYYEEPKKQRHSTGSAFMNAFNSILGDSLIINDYCNSGKLPLGIKFKVVLRSFRQMTIIEKFFIFNKLHNISYSTISESDCTALLSLGFTQITDDEIENLQSYFRTKQKSTKYTDSKYALFDFEIDDSRLFWQLSYQTWVTFYHDMVDTYTTRYSSKNPNEISSSFNDNIEQISRDSNFYVKAIQIIRKKLRHIPGKTSGTQELIKLYNNLNDVLSTMDEIHMEKVDGIHMINEKVLSANFYFHFLQSEEEKKSLLSSFLQKKARVREYVENVKVVYPLTTKTSFSSISIPILSLEKSIRFFNDFIKPRETSLVKSIRGTHIKTQYSKYGRKSEDDQSTAATTEPETQPSVATSSKQNQQVVPSVRTPEEPPNTIPHSASVSTEATKEAKQIHDKSQPLELKTSNVTIPQQNKPQPTETPEKASPPLEPQEQSSTIDIDETDKMDAVTVFRNWWLGEYKNFDFSKHQAVLSAKRLLQFFSVSMRQKDPTFHMDSSHASWRLIRKAIEKGEIIGLRVEEEGGRSFKVINQ